MLEAKQLGYSDIQIAERLRCTEDQVQVYTFANKDPAVVSLCVRSSYMVNGIGLSLPAYIATTLHRSSRWECRGSVTCRIESIPLGRVGVGIGVDAVCYPLSVRIVIVLIALVRPRHCLSIDTPTGVLMAAGVCIILVVK